MENERNASDSLDCAETFTMEDQSNTDDCLNGARGLINGVILSIPIWGLIYLLIYIFL